MVLLRVVLLWIYYWLLENSWPHVIYTRIFVRVNKFACIGAFVRLLRSRGSNPGGRHNNLPVPKNKKTQQNEDLVIISYHIPGVILWMRPANEGRRYIVTSSLIGWAHTQKIPDIRYISTRPNGSTDIIITQRWTEPEIQYLLQNIYQYDGFYVWQLQSRMLCQLIISRVPSLNLLQVAPAARLTTSSDNWGPFY